jgi:hypothetical protein
MHTELDDRYYIVKAISNDVYYITRGHPAWGATVTSCEDREEAQRLLKLLQGS